MTKPHATWLAFALLLAGCGPFDEAGEDGEIACIGTLIGDCVARYEARHDGDLDCVNCPDRLALGESVRARADWLENCWLSRSGLGVVNCDRAADTALRCEGVPCEIDGEWVTPLEEGTVTIHSIATHRTTGEVVEDLYSMEVLLPDSFDVDCTVREGFGVRTLRSCDGALYAGEFLHLEVRGFAGEEAVRITPQVTRGGEPIEIADRDQGEEATDYYVRSLGAGAIVRVAYRGGVWEREFTRVTDEAP